jgi:hypothetical protein
MATSKVLQVPQIIEIIGSKIRVGHPSLAGNIKTYIGAPFTAANSSLTVRDNNGLANGDYLILGEAGDLQSEEVAISGAVTRGTALTVATTTKFSHELDAGVTKIQERGIKIYGASSDGGSGTLIASVDAITTPIADAVMIQWDKPYTEYDLISTDTAYAYYFVKYTDGTTDSLASAYVAAAGLDPNSVEYMINQALVITDSRIDGSLLDRPMMIRWAQDCQDDISQFVYRDSLSGKEFKKDWSFEVVLDETTLTTVQGKSKYSLSSLPYQLKYPDSDHGIISVRVGVSRPLSKTQVEQYERYLANKPFTRLNGVASVGATSLTVDNTADFPTSGSFMVGSDVITYTGKTSGSFTGIPASGTGSITSAWADDSEVWQGLSQGLPVAYFLIDNELNLDKPVDSTNAGKTIKIRFFGKLPRLTKVSDETIVPFYNIFQFYLAAKIEARKQNKEAAADWMRQFQEALLKNALADKVPATDQQTYYNFADPLDRGVSTDSPITNTYYNW